MAKFAMSALTVAGTQIYGSAESTITSANYQFLQVSAMSVNILNFTDGATSTAVAVSGGANPLPASAQGYIAVLVSGQEMLIPFFRPRT